MSERWMRRMRGCVRFDLGLGQGRKTGAKSWDMGHRKAASGSKIPVYS